MTDFTGTAVATAILLTLRTGSRSIRYLLMIRRRFQMHVLMYAIMAMRSGLQRQQSPQGQQGQ